MDFKEWWAREEFFGGEGCMEAAELAWGHQADRIAELEAQLKANTLKKIMFEYEAAKEDSSFDGEHPIFQMAAHIDSLEAQLKTAKRDGILEAVREVHRLHRVEVAGAYMGTDKLALSATLRALVDSMTDYANGLAGEEQ